MSRKFFVSISLLAVATLSAQTIAEKKAGLASGGGEFDPQVQQQLKQVNRDLNDRQAELNALYAKVLPMYESGSPEQSYRELAARIRQLRAEILAIQENWRDTFSDVDKGEGYALWDQSATTLEQLVIDYGSQSYVYVIPPEIGKMPLSVSSSIPIPKALWGEMLELLLQEQGVGIQQLNPYLRRLYLLKDNRSTIQTITNDRKELDIIAKDARIAFVISPDPADSRRVASFLERFINPITTSFTVIGRDILLVSTVAEIQELLKLYDFVAKSRGELEYKLVPLLKVDTKEMSDILQGIFEQFAKAETVQVKATEKGPVPSAFSTISTPSESNGLKVIPLSKVARAVFLLGTRDEIAKAEEIISEVESQVGTARNKVVFTYRVKHADPEELGQLLNKIYDIFVQENIVAANELLASTTAEATSNAQAKSDVRVTDAPQQNVHTAAPTQTIWPGFYQEGQVSVNPTPVSFTERVQRPVNEGRANFLVDPKTSIIVMVVEPSILPRLKEVLRRLDVRRLMVQLDLLLVERVINKENDFGLNLLRVGIGPGGRGASNTHGNSLAYNDPRVFDACTGACSPVGGSFIAGILDFVLSRPQHDGAPAFDLAYRFLMTQSDTIVHSNPSVIALNETPANITVTTETSISVGVLPVQTGGGVQTSGGGEAFTRSQYGVNITITPTIHTRDPEDRALLDEDMLDYVLLECDVHFDDFSPTTNSRPDILRRQIKNFVNVLDGQTVILGGLRGKTSSDLQQKIPFLGEIPGVGRLFSNDALRDTTKEMFIFITPTIVKDPCEDIERIKLEQFARRPGDIPYFLCALDRARRREKERLFAQGMEILLGKPLERCIPWGDDPCEGIGGWDALLDRGCGYCDGFGNGGCGYRGACYGGSDCRR